MLEKIKDRLEKGKKIRAAKKAEREEKKSKAWIENYLRDEYWNVRKFFDDNFYKYMAILKNTKQRFLQFSIPTYLECMNQTFYLIEVNGDVVLKAHSEFIYDDNKKEVSERFYFMDKQCLCHEVVKKNGIYTHIQLEGRSWDSKTKSFFSSEEEERKLEYVKAGENNTQQEKEIIKFIDLIIDSTNDGIYLESLAAQQTNTNQA